MCSEAFLFPLRLVYSNLQFPTSKNSIPFCAFSNCFFLDTFPSDTYKPGLHISCQQLTLRQLMHFCLFPNSPERDRDRPAVTTTWKEVENRGAKPCVTR